MRFRTWFGLLVLTLLACSVERVPQRHAPIVIVDDAGDTTRLGVPAQRIVSLSPATTELVFALGAGSRLVGRTRWCDYPADALAVTSVGDGIPPNIESVLAQRPDLVLLYRSPQNAASAERFRAAGIAVLTLRIDLLEDVARLARLIGPAFGRTHTGDSLASVMDSALAAARERVAADSGARPSVLVLAWDQPPIAIGAGSFQSEILTLAGGRNVFADIATPSAPVSIETIAARKPDFILTADSSAPAWSARPEWKVVGAVAQRRFIRFDDPAFGRPSPRAPELIEALRSRIQAASR